MFKYLVGKVINISENFLEFETNSFGFEIKVINSKNFNVNENIKIYIYDFLNTNNYELYGFLTFNELYMFKKLISVNGIGPKKALLILKNIDSNQLDFLIKTKNVSKLKKIPGIGNFAENIVFKLSNKKEDKNLLKENNVYDSLISLGFSSNDVVNALNTLPCDLDEEQMLKEAIVRITKNA